MAVAKLDQQQDARSASLRCRRRTLWEARRGGRSEIGRSTRRRVEQTVASTRPAISPLSRFPPKISVSSSEGKGATISNARNSLRCPGRELTQIVPERGPSLNLSRRSKSTGGDTGHDSAHPEATTPSPPKKRPHTPGSNGIVSLPYPFGTASLGANENREALSSVVVQQRAQFKRNRPERFVRPLHEKRSGRHRRLMRCSGYLPADRKPIACRLLLRHWLKLVFRLRKPKPLVTAPH